MPDVIVHCPLCTAAITVDSEWNGMTLECPICKGNFELALPQEQAAVPPAVKQALQMLADSKNNRRPSYGYDPQTNNRRYLIKVLFKFFIFASIIAAGIWGYKKFTTITPESLGGNWLYVMTQKRANRDGEYGITAIAKHDFFPAASSKKQFFYRDANFTNLIVRQDTYDYYKGTVSFVRNGKKMQRPVIVDRRSSFCSYHFPVDYKANPEYMEEDGDLIFALATAINEDLKNWKYKSGKVASENVLECTISQLDNTKKIKLKVQKVECKDKISRIWVEIL